jgi:diguanylate cyclase with GGDEF domain
MADDEARRPSRARPVAEEPLERLEERAEELARRWAAELVLARPLAALGRISLAELAREGPDLCRQVLRAVRSEAELERLLGNEAPERGAAYPDRPAALSGEREPGAAAEAVEVLRGVLWEGLLDELPGMRDERSRERLLAGASDRLAHVCAVLGAAAADRARAARAARPASFPERPPASRSAPESRILIVDDRSAQAAAEPERAGAPAPAAREHPQPSSWAPARSADERRAPDAAARPGLAAPPASAFGRGEIAIRDARHEHGPAAWIHSIGQQLERFERDGLPFAVVLLEVASVDPAGPVEAEIEAALDAELRAAGGGALMREREGRYWMLVPRAERIGADALAARLERAVAGAAARGGLAVSVASGTAVCPDDGAQAAALAAHADIGLYAARWDARSAGAPGAPGEKL